MASGNGKSGRDILLRLLDDVEELKTSQTGMAASIAEMQKSVTQSIAASAKMAGTLQAFVEVFGRQEARMDAFDARLSKLESK